MSGNAKYVIAGLLLLAGAAFLWMLVKPEPPPPAAALPPVPKAPERSTALATNDLVLDAPEPEPTPEPTPAPTPNKKRGSARGEWDCAGEMTIESITKIMRANQTQVRSCYERRLKSNNVLQGDLSLKLKVGSTGAVTSTAISGSLRDNEVYSCVRSLAEKWTFPTPEGGNCAVVQIPFRFTPKN